MHTTRTHLHMLLLLLSLLAGTAVAGVTALAQNTEPVQADTFAQAIERAHNIAAWNSKEMLKTDIAVEFDGESIVKGVMYYDIQGNRVRIEQKDGPVMVFDGARAWVSPADAEQQRARFHLLTWSFLLAAPFRLHDPGSHLEKLGRMQINGTNYDAAKLTFDKGIGGSPNDWYIVYKDIGTDLLYAMAYVVTYGTPISEAEKKPHAISYASYSYIDEVWLPLSWQFWNWSEEEDIHGEPLGKGFLRNVEFRKLDESLFQRPEDAREDKVSDALAPAKPSE